MSKSWQRKGLEKVGRKGVPRVFLPLLVPEVLHPHKGTASYAEQIFRMDSSSPANSRDADLMFFRCYHPSSLSPACWLGRSGELVGEGNEPLQWVEQLS